MKRLNAVWFVLLMFAVAASGCGGGGGGSSTPAKYTTGGTISGLAGSGLVLQNNGTDDLTISASGAFTFAISIEDGSAYAVTIKTQPSGPAQTCTVNNGSGKLAGVNITNVTVTCATNAYTTGGTVSGLAGTGLVLQNNSTDDLTIASDGTFTFAKPVADGANYTVTVKTQPSSVTQICTVNNGSGTVAGAKVTGVTVACSTTTYTVGLSVSGLAGTGLVLQNNNADDLSVATNGTFTFTTPVVDGANYAVTVKTQPHSLTQTCTVNNGTGPIAGANVSNVTIACSTNNYAVNLTVSGLAGTGLVLQNNGANDKAIAANGASAFTTLVASGANYAVIG